MKNKLTSLGNMFGERKIDHGYEIRDAHIPQEFY